MTYRVEQIEPIAIALYESDCRAFNTQRYSYDLSYRENPVRDQVLSWGGALSWANLEPEERQRWRAVAVEMLEEARAAD